ncbi:MAG: hypothetical protein AAGH15_28945, partial [Myxococcota bacterium]
REHLALPGLGSALELERDLGAARGLGPAPSRDALLGGLAGRLPPGDLRALRLALAELDGVRKRLDDPAGPPRLGPRDLARILRAGERAREAVVPRGR